MKAIFDFFLPLLTIIAICALLCLFVISSNDWFYTRANRDRGTFNPNKVIEDTRSNEVVEEIEKYSTPH